MKSIGFRKRLLTGVLFFGLFAFSLFLGELYTLGLVSLIVLRGAYEFSRMTYSRKENIYLFSLCLFLSFGSLILYDPIFSLLPLIFFFILRVSLFTKENPLNRTAHVMFGFFLCALMPALASISLIKNPSYFVIFLVSIIGADSMAFFVGNFVGKTPLAPEISAKKTKEGFWGSFFGSFLFGSIACFLLLEEVDWVIWIPFFLLVNITAQVGDLLESSLKRQMDVKDSGNILPGHGGILDRLDSTYFASPLIYILTHYILN